MTSSKSNVVIRKAERQDVGQRIVVKAMEKPEEEPRWWNGVVCHIRDGQREIRHKAPNREVAMNTRNNHGGAGHFGGRR